MERPQAEEISVLPTCCTGATTTDEIAELSRSRRAGAVFGAPDRSVGASPHALADATGRRRRQGAPLNSGLTIIALMGRRRTTAAPPRRPQPAFGTARGVSGTMPATFTRHLRAVALGLSVCAALASAPAARTATSPTPRHSGPAPRRRAAPRTSWSISVTGCSSSPTRRTSPPPPRPPSTSRPPGCSATHATRSSSRATPTSAAPASTTSHLAPAAPSRCSIT